MTRAELDIMVTCTTGDMMGDVLRGVPAPSKRIDEMTAAIDAYAATLAANVAEICAREAVGLLRYGHPYADGRVDAAGAIRALAADPAALVARAAEVAR